MTGLRGNGIWSGIWAAGGLAVALGMAPFEASAADADGVTLFQDGAVRPQVVWAMAVGETDAAPDEADGLAVDADGYTVISGSFRDGLRLGETTLTSRGEGDMYIARITPAGTVQWVRQFGGDGDDDAFDVAADPAGALYANGWFTGAVDFEGTVLTSAGQSDHVLMAFEPDGDVRWVKAFGGTEGDAGNALAVNGAGSVFATALSEGTYAAGGLGFSHGGGSRDSFILRVAPNGQVAWVLPVDGTGTDRVRALAVDGLGHVYAGFQFRGDLRVGDQTLTSRGDWDGAIAKVSPEGYLLGLIQVGGSGADSVSGLGGDDAGNLYVSGLFSGQAKIADRSAQATGERSDDYVLKLRPDGTSAWLMTLSGPGRSKGPDLVANSLGAMLSTLVDDPVTLTLNDQPVGTILPPGGQPTSALVAVNADGHPVWSYTPVSGLGALGETVAVAPNSRYVAQAVRFRGSLTVGTRTFTTPGQRDSAVLLLQIAP